MEWEDFWAKFIDEHKLRHKIEEMNQVDSQKGHIIYTEEICRCIYEDYNSLEEEYKKQKNDIWEIIQKFKGVHLHTSRIKSAESLIDKVIRKRYDWLADDDSKYANINVDNYKDIITDLVGLRLIINYRGHWRDMHDEILSEFPYASGKTYESDKLLPHISGCNIQAEPPKVYYAEGDDIKQYLDCGLLPKKHKMNYRSIHYTLSFQGMYIELQIRTIYDEAWSDCDHSYVYKRDDNRSHSALEQMSGILAKLTNISNDIGEHMKEIYDSESIVDDHKNGWITSSDIIGQIDHIMQRMEKVEADLKDFKNKLTVC